MSANFNPNLNTYSNAQPFRFWCQKVLPLVYDDSLSYYELLAKVVKYLNNMMSDVNLMESDIEALHTAYAQLETYVNEYFDSLDIQAEVNNKLDEMSENGFFDAILTPMFNTYTASVDATISDMQDYISTTATNMQGAIDVLDARMDTFASLPEGSTSADAELIDIRIMANGAVADTAGNAVRTQVTDLKSVLDDDESLLLDISYQPVTETVTPTMTSGLCKADGSISASSNYEYTNIIPVTPGDVISGKATVLSGATAPEEPCYIRYWTAYSFDTVMPNSGTDTGQVTEFTVPYGINGIRLTLNLGLYESGSLSVRRRTSVENKSVKAELITTDEEIVDAITVEKLGANLINKSLAETGGLLQDGNIYTTSAWANYKTSDYIPVEAGQTYRLYLANAGGQSTSTTRLICGVFDSAKSLLTYSSDINISYHDITPSVDGFVRVCCVDNPTAYFTANLMLIKGTNTVPYENYRITKVLSDDISPVNALFPSVGGILYGKKWCPCGDSFTYYTNKQFESGKYAGLNQTYPYLIALRNGMEIEPAFFSSGRTLAYPSDGTFSNSLTCPTNPGFYQNIPEDADYVTIMLGINDSQHTGSGSTGDGEDATGVITLGTINDNTTATYYGAWNVVLGWLRENRPFAHVGIIVTNGITANGDWKAAQIAIAKKWGYPLIDLNGDEKTPAMIRCYNPNVSDEVKRILVQKQAVDYNGSTTGNVNTHPNWQAHEYESTFIEAWLRTL